MDDDIICTFCNTRFLNSKTFENHKISAKYCLKIQGKPIIDLKNYTCEGCHKNFSSKQRLASHYLICKKTKINILKQKIKKLNEELQKFL